MASVSVLVTTDFKKTFTIQCDASPTGEGAVLFQGDGSCGEHWLPILELESYAAILSITKFRAYERGSPLK